MSGYTGQVPDTLPQADDWVVRGACRGMDPDVFSSSIREREAKQVCLTCEVRSACLAWIMKTESGQSVFYRDGVVAALTARERTILDPDAPNPPERQDAPASPKQQAPRQRAPKKPKALPRELAKCGTNAAYRRHVKAGEPIDDACREAHTEATRQVRHAAEDRKVRARWVRSETDAQIAAATGLSKLRVRRVRERLGLLANQPHRSTQAPAADTRPT